MTIESFEQNKIERLEADIAELKKQLEQKSKQVEILEGVLDIVRTACQVSSATHAKNKYSANPYSSEIDSKTRHG